MKKITQFLILVMVSATFTSCTLAPTNEWGGLGIFIPLLLIGVGLMIYGRKSALGKWRAQNPKTGKVTEGTGLPYFENNMFGVFGAILVVVGFVGSIVTMVTGG